MRVIYLVRAAQLLLVLQALWLLYSVTSFCELKKISTDKCATIDARPPFIETPEQMDEHVRIIARRPAGTRGALTTSSAPTTAHEPASTQSSTVPHTVTSSEGAKIRKKWQEEMRELPGNGATEGKRLTAKKEKNDEKKEEVTTPSNVVKDSDKRNETSDGTTIVKTVVNDKADENTTDTTTTNPDHTTTAGKTDVKVADKNSTNEVKKEEKKSDHLEKKEVKVEEKIEQFETTTVKEEPTKGAKIEIPVATSPRNDLDEKKVEDTTDFSTSSTTEERHHTVKKDLKARVQEPVEITEVSTSAPKLSAAQQKHALEHTNSVLQTIRCLEVTSDDYFGSQKSPYAQHLKGLSWVGPVLVAISIYLVCTVLRTRLSHEAPIEFTNMMSCAFHCGMWFVVGITMYFIADHWKDNWITVSGSTFAPDFPCQWNSLIWLSGLMMLTVAAEACFQKRLHYEVVFERSYRCYEVVGNVPSPIQQSRFTRTEVAE